MSTTADPEFHPPLVYPKWVIPAYELFQKADTPSSMAEVPKLLAQNSNQKALVHMTLSDSAPRKDVLRSRKAYPSLAARLDHISPSIVTGSHKPFDLSSKLNIEHRPNAFQKTFLPSVKVGMSQYQMSLYLKLILGLPIPALFQNSPICSCGQQNDCLGSHRINCRQHAGKD